MKMATLLAALLLGVVAGTPAEAQFGIRGGVNLTRFVGGEEAQVESKQGLNFGGSMRVLTLGPIGIVPEVYYAEKGAKIDDAATSGGTQLDFSLSYLEVPVLARIDLPVPGMGRLNPYVAAGPVFGWKLNCEVSMVGGSSSGTSECGEQFGSVGGAFRDADQGFVVSGGVDLRVLGMGGINLDARLVQGLARLQEDAAGQPKLRNQAFSVMLGYSFGI